MNRYRIAGGLVAILVALLAGTPAYPFAHLWEINEIFTNHDGTVQFIEMKTPVGANLETQMTGQTLRATSTVGGVVQPQVIFTFPGPNLVSPTGNKHLLIATSTFAAQAGSVTPNYNTLPANFFVPNADSIVFTFPPAFSPPETFTLAGSAIPKDGVNSVTDANPFGVANFVAGVNSPTNFAGASGSINVPPPPVTTGDYNGDLTVNAADYTVWRDTLGQTGLPLGSGADGDSDGMIDNGDYDFWKLRFGNVLGGAGGGATGSTRLSSPKSASASAVPEPVTLVMAALGLLTLALASIRTGRAPA